MYYELWDIEVGNGIARYADDREMASLVRTLVDAYGDAYAKDLDLTIENEGGTVLESFSGHELVAWANQHTDQPSPSSGSARVVASRRPVRSKGQGLAANSAARATSHRHQGSKVHKKD